MKLQRYSTTMLWDRAGLPVNGEHARDVYRATDVDALLARIRLAVDAERASMRETNGCVLPGATLDALLAGGGE